MAAPLTQLTPGMVVGGDFRVVKLLSAGGMGAVYIAEQLSTGKRRAVKVMHPQLVADPKLRERFEQEARVGALIASDHVVEVIAAGVESATGMPWIAMELLEGEDLATYVQRRGIPSTEQLREMVQQLCHALGAAHAAGVVHRDLKPENVFLAKARTAAGRPSIKVLDFGIAKVAARARTTATAAIGTPAWMSPEQTDPRAAITPSTDVWALGLIVYWLMTGRPYWVSAGDPTVSMHAVMREILFEPMAPASLRAEQRGAAGRLPPGFDAWFERCVAREPKARFATATELLASFEQVCSGFESEAMGPPESIPGSLASGSTSPQSTRSYLVRAGLADASSTGEGDAGSGAGSDPARAAKSSSGEGRVAVAASAKVSSSDWEQKTELAPSGPTASAFAAASPTSPGEGHRDGAAGSRPRSVRRNMALGVGIGLAAAVGALFAVRSLTGPGPAPSTTEVETAPSASASSAPPIAPERRTEPDPTPSASAEATPSPSAISVPSARSSDARSIAPIRKPSPSATATPSGTPESVAEPAPGAKKPFNLQRASQSVADKANSARFICGRMSGPRMISGIVYFAPAGNATRIEGDIGQYLTAAGSCVKGTMLASYTDPFDGTSLGVPFGVHLPAELQPPPSQPPPPQPPPPQPPPSPPQ